MYHHDFNAIYLFFFTAVKVWLAKKNYAWKIHGNHLKKTRFVSRHEQDLVKRNGKQTLDKARQRVLRCYAGLNGVAE